MLQLRDRRRRVERLKELAAEFADEPCRWVDPTQPLTGAEVVAYLDAIGRAAQALGEARRRWRRRAGGSRGCCRGRPPT